MRHFRFGDFEDFPLDQEVLTEWQNNSFKGIEELLNSLGSTESFLLSGCQIEPTGFGNVDVTPGYIWHPEFGICTFEGETDLPEGATGYHFTFADVPEMLVFEDGPEEGVYYHRAIIENIGTTHVNEYQKVCARKWWHYLGARASTSGWVNVALTSPEPGEYLEYFHNKVSNTVFVRGAKKHFVLASDDPPMQMGFSGIPEGVKPTKNVYFRTELATHLAEQKRDLYGSLYLGDSGRLLTTGVLSISQRKLYGGISTDFLHYFSFSYQL